MKRKIYYDGAYYLKSDVLKIIEVTNPDGKRDNVLYLAVSSKDDSLDFALLNDLDQDDVFLSTHKIFSSSYINHLTFTNKYFAPLSNAIAETNQNGYELTPEANTLLAYYYLTESAVSVSFIEHWLVSLGYVEEQAQELAMAVYVARTERTDCSDVFDIESTSDLLQSDKHPHLLRITSKEDFFRQAYHQNLSSLVYDDFAAFELLSSAKDITIMDCKDIPETAFMVEDHHHVILGLSVKLCEALALCEFSATPFYEFILGKCNFAETTYLGLGYFINKYASDLVKMLNETGLKVSIRTIDNQRNTNAFPLRDGVSFFLLQTSDKTRLPIFLDIEKS